MTHRHITLVRGQVLRMDTARGPATLELSETDRAPWVDLLIACPPGVRLEVVDLKPYDPAPKGTKTGGR